MTEFLDTNVVVRYLTGDPPGMADRAAALIEGDLEFTVSPLIIAEVSFVLTRVCGRARSDVLAALIRFIQRANIAVLGVDTTVAVEALELCQPSNAVNVADALLWAEARSTHGAVHTFDRKFPSRDIVVRRP